MNSDCCDTWKNDAVCDEIKNNKNCNFDGGDCCQGSIFLDGQKRIMKYCHNCTCLGNFDQLKFFFGLIQILLLNHVLVRNPNFLPSLFFLGTN